MRNFFCTIILIWGTLLIAEDGPQVIFKDSQKYMLSGEFDRLHDSIKKNEFNFYINKNASSQITIKIVDTSKEELEEVTARKAQVCLKIKKSCDFQCEARLEKVYKIFPPWEKLPTPKSVFEIPVACKD